MPRASSAGLHWWWTSDVCFTCLAFFDGGKTNGFFLVLPEPFRRRSVCCWVERRAWVDRSLRQLGRLYVRPQRIAAAVLEGMRTPAEIFRMITKTSPTMLIGKGPDEDKDESTASGWPRAPRVSACQPSQCCMTSSAPP